VMPEFGRDPDGSSTNGFSITQNTEMCRLTWMMVLGSCPSAAVIEREVRQIDVAPSLGALFGVHCGAATGARLREFAV